MSLQYESGMEMACAGEMDLAAKEVEKPAWVIYAESRGGNITIDINQEEYIFIYLDLSKDLMQTQ